MPLIPSLISHGAKRAVYSAGQAARILWYTGHYAYGRRLMGPLTAPGNAPYAEEFGPLDRERLKVSFRELFRRDWENIKNGRYKMPVDFRQRPSIKNLMRQSRDYLRDAEKVARRKASNGHSEVYSMAHKEKFPRYYLQNFHYQTGGWLSDDSADRYDMQVETLFTGAAGPMRRQALPFIGAALEGKDVASVRLLDLGCGTGRFLSEVKDNWPRLDVTALDLSPSYLGKARASLGRWPDVTYAQTNAEDTKLETASFDIITAVYLFHELPPAVRERVAMEAARLLKPGGVFLVVDTIQYGDAPGLDVLLEHFPRGFHEPYYDSYCRTQLTDLFGRVGLEKQDEITGFLTKVTAFTAKA